MYRTKDGQYEELIQGLKKLLTIRKTLDTKLKISILFRSNMPYKDLVELPDYRNEILPLLTEEEQRDIYVPYEGFRFLGRSDPQGRPDWNHGFGFASLD